MHSARPSHALSSFEPGIYFDEVHRHQVCTTRRQHERLLDVGSAGFDIVTTTDISELATRGDFAAVPALEIVSVVEIGGDKCVKSHGNGLAFSLAVGARRTEVAAPPGIEVRDALAICRILAQYLAFLDA